MRTGINVAGDIIDNNQPIEESLQARWQEAKTNLKNKAQNKLNQVLVGSGKKRKKKHQLGGVRKKQKIDIFD